MSGGREANAANLQPAQTTALSLLLDLEARWENLRNTPSQSPQAGHGTQDLLARQKVYEAFHSMLVAYNNRYAPAHISELLLNTPSRLGKWCQTMRDIYLQVERDPQAVYPVHLLEKAFRWADRMAARMNKAGVNRLTPPGTIRSAIEELEAVGRWCDDLAQTSSLC